VRTQIHQTAPSCGHGPKLSRGHGKPVSQFASVSWIQRMDANLGHRAELKKEVIDPASQEKAKELARK
jgi:hypothetical protein